MDIRFQYYEDTELGLYLAKKGIFTLFTFNFC